MESCVRTGGAIKIESDLGKGTTVRVYLPYYGSDEPSDPVDNPGDDGWSDRGTILLVDDEEPVRSAADRFLRQLGFSVITAVDGIEGYERFMSNRGQIRAVVMDLTMPGLDGGSLSAAIRKIDQELPILLMSGYNKTSVMHQLNGSMPFMQKPFRFQDFRRHMKDLLGGDADRSVD